MTRKEFLTLIAVSAAAPALAQNDTPAAPKPAPSAAPRKAPPRPPKLPPIQPGPPYVYAGPLLGHVSDTEARVWIRGTAAVPWKVRISESADMATAREVEGSALTDANGHVGTAIIDGLQADKRYFYEVALDGRIQTSRPIPSFVTAPPAGHRGRLRIGFGSCVGRNPSDSAASWGEIAMRRDAGPEHGGFDLFLMLGDNHYGDTTDVDLLRIHYTAHRLSPAWQQMSAQTPIYAIWDDHDYGPNNSDSTSKGKENSLRIFSEYWANPSVGEPDNPGCYFTFERSGVQFFMLDCRYYRTPNNAPDDESKTMLGPRQLEWLKKELKASKAPVKLLATGSEWETYSQPDSWAKFLRERNEFFNWLQAEKITGVMFLSGDRHFSAGYHILDRYVELTSGPLGSGNATLRPNQERFTGHDEGKMWMILDIDTSKPEPEVVYELWQAGGGRLERRGLTWASINGAEKIERSPFPLRPGRMEAKPAQNKAG